MTNVNVNTNDVPPNLERIELLCQALESGRYEQGNGALRLNGKYCCIGVACDVVDPAGWRRIHEGDMHHEWRFDTEVGYMPTWVAEWYGFNGTAEGSEWIGNPKLQVNSSTRLTMTLLNDSYGYSFVEIARAIRRTYLPDTIEDSNAGTDADASHLTD